MYDTAACLGVWYYWHIKIQEIPERNHTVLHKTKNLLKVTNASFKRLYYQIFNFPRTTKRHKASSDELQVIVGRFPRVVFDIGALESKFLWVSACTWYWAIILSWWQWQPDLNQFNLALKIFKRWKDINCIWKYYLLFPLHASSLISKILFLCKCSTLNSYI